MRTMKKILIVGAVLLTGFTSCRKYLDVNKDPNTATGSTAPLMMGQAITYTASNVVSYNSYGAWMVGYTSNAGGYGGWGSALTYDYANTSYTGLWNGAYDNMQDFQFILQETEGKDEYAWYNGIARIMKVFHFQFLVDTYGDIPYSEALKGIGNVNPSYDKAEDIYKDLYSQLDIALETINNAVAPLGLNHSLGNADPMFNARANNSNINNWKRLANTLKLRLLIRASETGVFAGVTPTFDPVGFLTTDAIVNPGYGKVAGQQNPFWNAFHSSVTDAGAARSLITTYFMLSFYNGTKMEDEARAKAIYRGVFTPARNQTGITDDNVPLAPTGSSVWYSGNGSSYSNSDNYDNAVGVLKGRGQGQPIFTAAESYFLQAEGRMKGILTTGDDVETLFNKGIEASFLYLFRTADGTFKTNTYFSNIFSDGVITEAKVKQAAADYHTEGDNTTNYLVNINLATTNEERLEAIITQKYIALNMIHGHEAWAEFRRTGYPKIDNSLPFDEDLTFVSTLSQATTPDRTLGRLLYPDTEYQLNTQNVPTSVTVFGSYVFWDRRN